VNGTANELGIVFKAEILRKLRSRIFWLATIGGAFGIALVIQAPLFFSGVVASSTSNIVLAGPQALRARATTLIEARRNYHVVASIAT